jgi:hypothetical protein
MEKYTNEKGEYYNSFIYRWFDRSLNKYYIGSHYGNVNDGYLFGGIDIKKEYKRRPNDFEREILSYHLVSEYSEIRKIEKEYLIKYDVENNDLFYNRTNELPSLATPTRVLLFSFVVHAVITITSKMYMK